MANNQEIEKIALLQERIAKLEGSSSSAHIRLDKLEGIIREDVRDIKNDIKDFSDKAATREDLSSFKDAFDLLVMEVKELAVFVNKGKGYLGAMLLLGGVVSFVVQKVVSKIFF